MFCVYFMPPSPEFVTPMQPIAATCTIFTVEL